MGSFLTIFKRVVLALQECVEVRHSNLKDQKGRYSRFCIRLVRLVNSDPEPVTGISYRALGNLLHSLTTPPFISFFTHAMKIMLTYLIRNCVNLMSYQKYSNNFKAYSVKF